MPEKRVIVTDIDYTLTDAELRLDLGAAQKIRELEERGVKVILDSGRNLAATGSLAQLIGTSGFVVAENGGVIAKYQTPIKILGRIEDARAALRMLRKRIGNKVRERPDSRLGMRLSSVSLERSLNPEKARELLRKSKMGIDLIDTGVTYVLLDARFDKGNALAQLGRLAKIPLTNSTGIGDNYNDLPLFREVAHKIAVGNAPEEVRQEADYVCRHTFGRGFLEAVEHTGL
jgi:phosphoglycolate phosphatase (TIGR01487 family)